MKQIKDYNAKLSVKIDEWRAKEGLPSLAEWEKSAKNSSATDDKQVVDSKAVDDDKGMEDKLL